MMGLGHGLHGFATADGGWTAWTPSWVKTGPKGAGGGGRGGDLI